MARFPLAFLRQNRKITAPLAAQVPTPLEYMQVVQRAGNSKDLAQARSLTRLFG